MKPTINDILQLLETIAPSALAEKWDNIGLLVGSPDNRVQRILIGLDPTNTLLDEAIDRGADTLITHHPVIFHALSAIHTNNPAGRLLQKALSHNINIIGCHTNLDSAADGVNDVLGNALGLTGMVPLQPAALAESRHHGLGRVGVYKKPLSRHEFITRLFDLLKLPHLTMAGMLPEKIGKVALCGGSGSDFATAAYACGADVYISAEIKHNVALWANEVGFAVIDGTHYATEKPATFYLAEKLRENVADKNWKTQIHVTRTEQHPFVSIHTSSFMKSKI